RIYEFNSGTSMWDQKGQDIDGEADNDRSGGSVSLSDDGLTVAIGAILNDGSGAGSGHVRIYEFNSGTSMWDQKGGDIDGEAAGDQSGESVSLSADGSTVAIGAFLNSGSGMLYAGHMRVYNFPIILAPCNLVASSAETSSISCNGMTDGQVTASATGGSPGYSYLWHTGGTAALETGLGAGTHTVIVTDDDNCTSSSMVTLTEPALLRADASVTRAISCNGEMSGNLTASETGGTSPFSYTWSTGGLAALETGLTSGNYSVIVTDNNYCQSSAMVDLPEPALLTATSSVTQSLKCNGDLDGQVTASETGGTSPFIYTWNTGGTAALETHLGAGTYSITITDYNWCTSTSVVTLTDPITNQTPTASTSVFCTANSSTTITISSSNTGINYYLRNNANDSIVAGPTAGTGTGLTFNTGNIDSTTAYNVYAINPKPGTALDFDGSDDYVEITNPHPDFDFGTGDFTIEAWIKTDIALSAGVEQAVIANTYEGSTVFWLGRTGNKVVFNVAGTASQTISSTVINDDNWHHIAGVRNAGAIELYVDGIMDGSGNVSSNSLDTSSTLSIGNFANDFHFNGQIDDVRFWNTARTESQIVPDINTCVEGPQPGLVAVYDFEDGTGYLARDMSHNGHDGSLNNMDDTDWVTGTSNCPTCDLEMAITAIVTIVTVDVSVTAADPMLSANYPDAAYQWLDCGTNSEVAAATSQTYTPTYNGNFAVRINDEGCIDISDCYPILTTSIENQALNNAFVYPNPTQGAVNIDLGNLTDVTITVRAADSKLVYIKNNIAGGIHQFELRAEQGVYFVEVISPEGTQHFQIIKE
ncbi:MAG: T9SS type A sorting domain-containing protein, partial [Flavobacteriales bacterium]|nr:T9SS type A sorting domain-containing protein [Flavobacteriales bacterium]